MNANAADVQLVRTPYETKPKTPMRSSLCRYSRHDCVALHGKNNVPRLKAACAGRCAQPCTLCSSLFEALLRCPKKITVRRTMQFTNARGLLCS
eukprot:g6428.t1